MLLKNLKRFLPIVVLIFVAIFMRVNAGVENVSQDVTVPAPAPSAVESETTKVVTTPALTTIDDSIEENDENVADDMDVPVAAEDKDLIPCTNKESSIEVEEEIALHSDATSDKGFINRVDDNLMGDMDEEDDDDGEDDNLF